MSQEITSEDCKESLKKIIDTDLEKNIVDGGLLKSVEVLAGVINVSFKYEHAAKSKHAQMRASIQQTLRSLPGIKRVDVSIEMQVATHSAQRGVQLIPKVKNIIAIASGKGGVGKSTTTVNLALALSAEGARVGVLDADIYGPSIPTMLGITGVPESEDGSTIYPKEGHGLQASSIGFLMDKDEAMIWRGPMVTQALEQLLRQTKWDDLDYLLVDMPPGTGDIHLTLSQRVPVTGAVIVTTPQEIALMDARKGLKMFQKVNVPILGIVENMSLHICSKCGHQEHIFGSGGAQKMSDDYGVPILGRMPLDMRIREHADDGRPSLVSDPDGEASLLYKKMARNLSVTIARLTKDMTHRFPKIVVQAT